MYGQRQLLRWINKPFSEWEKSIHKKEVGGTLCTWFGLVANLDHFAWRTVRIAAYIEAKAIYHYSHRVSIEYANKKTTKVRRAIGYSYPDKQ